MFDVAWLNDPEFSLWLSGLPDAEYAYCKLCNKEINVYKGKGPLRAHAKGIKHTELAYQCRKGRTWAVSPRRPNPSQIASRPSCSQYKNRIAKPRSKSASPSKKSAYFNSFERTEFSSGTGHAESFFQQSFGSQSMNMPSTSLNGFNMPSTSLNRFNMPSTSSIGRFLESAQGPTSSVPTFSGSTHYLSHSSNQGPNQNNRTIYHSQLTHEYFSLCSDSDSDY